MERYSKTKDFNEMVLTLAEASLGAYSPYEGTHTNDIGDWKPVRMDIKDGMLGAKFVVIYKKGDDYIISFRGTKSMSEWGVDFSTNPTNFIPYDNDRFIPTAKNECSIGFFALYSLPKPVEENLEASLTLLALAKRQTEKSSLAYQLIEFLNTTKVDNLYITGHSLGGALAKMFLYDIMSSALSEDKMPNHVAGITFGAPRIGSVDFSKSFNDMQKTWAGKGKTIQFCRVAASNDPVTAVSSNYVHGDEEVELSSGGIITHLIGTYINLVKFELGKGEEKNFTISGKSLIGGKMMPNGKSLIDLIPNKSRLSDLIPGIKSIKVLHDSGKIYDYRIVIEKESGSGVTMKFTDGENETYSKWAWRDRTHTLDYDSKKPTIVKITWN